MHYIIKIFDTNIIFEPKTIILGVAQDLVLS